MKKIHLLTKIIFHTSNIGLVILYLYPGSVFGWLIYSDFQKQPQITSDFLLFLSYHSYSVCFFFLLSACSRTRDDSAVSLVCVYILLEYVCIHACAYMHSYI